MSTTRSGEPVRAVVDTYLFVSGLISQRGLAARLVEALTEGRSTLLFSPSARDEYRRVLPRPKFAQAYGITPAEVTAFLFLIESNAVLVEPATVVPVAVRDPKDEPFVAAALGGNADYLVTGDDDLLVLHADPQLGGLKVVTVGEFLAALGPYT